MIYIYIYKVYFGIYHHQLTIVNLLYVMLMPCTDSALGESAALRVLLAALQRPQPQVQICDASC